MPVDYLADLTPSQAEAVQHINGPLLIVAGPGSGKTRVITRRIAYLLQQGVRASNILAVTFTNKAAAEMRNRVYQLLPASEKVDSRGVVVPPHRFLRISTFHSFGVYLLRVHHEVFGLERNFTIYDQTERNRMVKTALDAAEIDSGRFTPESIQGAISKAKNDLLTPIDYAKKAGDFFRQTVARVYPVYEKRMRDANALDFDDLLLMPALALKTNPEFRAELDNHFKYVLIDEYQDTNKAQYELVLSLSRDDPNLCVVGDPDQSIYKWRGSDIRNILDFERDFPAARIINLDRNYRSTKTILHAADKLIAHNKQRKPRHLYTENEQGQPVRVLTFENGLEEAAGVAQRIRQAVENDGRKYRDFAIFLRINALSRSLESAFIKERVPYQMVRGLAFFDRKENRDIIGYLRLLVNPRDDLSFLRVVNEPPRGIGKTSLEHLQAYAEPREMNLMAATLELDKIPAIKGKAVTGLRSFVKIMDELRQFLEASPDEVMRQVLNRTGYHEMLKDSEDDYDQERLANIEELITAAKEFAAEDPTRTIADFLENITLASDADGYNEGQDSVAVMTLHAAKGLEFPVVYMLAVEQGILPHERSLATNDELEEERRLAFVGMTRAKEELFMCSTRMREFRGQTLYAVHSMFLDELPEDAIEQIDLAAKPAGSPSAYARWRSGTPAAEAAWEDAGIELRSKRQAVQEKASAAKKDADYAEGMIVQHDKYGIGKITSVSGHGAMRKLKIRFAKAGEKSFVANKVSLNIVSRV
jgi:DNA helicase-2/ATP-dependent DNA helicase PcrA